MTLMKPPKGHDTVESSVEDVLGESRDPSHRQAQRESLWQVVTHAPGPKGKLPFTPEFLLDDPSGNHFGMSQNAGMGWDPSELMRKQFMVLSTAGGVRNEDGTPVALGLHTGHWELMSLIKAAAVELRRLHSVPFAAFCSDPCDGRTQGTTGMLDSLPYRNDAAQVFRRIARSLPTARGYMGVATCDKGLPAMMMAMAGLKKSPVIIVPGGVTLAPEHGEDAGRIQSLGARFAQGEITIEYAQDVGCRACASPGGGCQFLGTAGTSQVVCESLGLALTHGALSPSGTPVWLDIAVLFMTDPSGARLPAGNVTVLVRPRARALSGDMITLSGSMPSISVRRCLTARLRSDCSHQSRFSPSVRPVAVSTEASSSPMRRRCSITSGTPPAA